jgi:hypothetical protein
MSASSQRRIAHLRLTVLVVCVYPFRTLFTAPPSYGRVMDMAITPLPTVTLPVLIRSSNQTSVDGAGVLFAQRTEFSGLHVVTKEEAFRQIDKWKRSQPELWQLVSGTALLQQAQREKDWVQFQNAFDSVHKWVPRIFEREIQVTRDSRSWKKAGWAYSGLMSNLLQTVRFIIWYSQEDNRVRPGLFCPTWEAAVCSVVGMDHIRICKKPGCNVPFIPEPNTQAYCVPAHGNAHRVARAKAEKRRKSKSGK